MLTTNEIKLSLPVSNRDHRRGPENADVTLVEYGDFECSYCGAAYKILKNIESQMPNLLFVFRNFPLSELHPHALLAAAAAEAAAMQDRFWPMHDLLFENQNSLTAMDLQDYAVQLNLDIDRFNNDLQGESVSRKLQEDFNGGVQSGVDGTPSFFINGYRFIGDWTESDLLLKTLKSFSPKDRKERHG